MQSEVRKVLEKMREQWDGYSFYDAIRAAERADAARREEPVQALRQAVAELVARWSVRYVPIDAANMMRDIIAELNVIATKPDAVEDRHAAKLRKEQGALSDKLQHADERLRRLAKGESLEEVYNDSGQYDSFTCRISLMTLKLEKDRKILADAYLAEHPADDDEPVTHEWLDSLFGAEEYICIEQDGNFDEVITWIETIGNVLIPMPKTRGDLRRLCKGLKIELKEPS